MQELRSGQIGDQSWSLDKDMRNVWTKISGIKVMHQTRARTRHPSEQPGCRAGNLVVWASSHVEEKWHAKRAYLSWRRFGLRLRRARGALHDLISIRNSLKIIFTTKASFSYSMRASISAQTASLSSHLCVHLKLIMVTPVELITKLCLFRSS